MTLSSPRLRTQMRPSSGSISMATSKRKSTSSPRSLATRSMVLTRETLLTCMGQAARAAMAGGCGRQFPRQQFIEPVHGMAGDAQEDVREPRLRFDAVHLTGHDET